MNKTKTLLTLSSLLTLSACSFQGAGDKNTVQLKAGSKSEKELVQGLGGKGRASTTAPWLESGSRRKETPESYQRAIDRALAHIKAKQDSMLTNPDFSFSVRTVIMSEAGEETIRFEIRFKGRRVMGGDVVVQSKSDGSLKKIEKSLQKEIKLSASGLISSEKARDIALSVFDGELHESVEPEAIIYAVGGEPKEAFEVVLKGSHGANKHPSELHVFVDARSGEVMTKWDAICEGIEKESAAAAEQMLSAEGTDQVLSEDSNVRLGAKLLPLDQTFKLHSKPNASKVIYLDFNGHTTTGTEWNTWNNSALGPSFYSPPYSFDNDNTKFSDGELALIQTIWQLVVADFAAFDVNVTTQEPPQDWLIKSDSNDVNYGIRVVITNYGPMSGSAGGIAYIDSFNLNRDTPCFVYNTTLFGISEAISHEVGHTLGLSHDGTFDGVTNVDYYAGNSSEGDENGWAPIMGLGYYRNMTTWDNGTYYQSNNAGDAANFGKGADDLAIVTSYNGFGYEQDLESDARLEATPLLVRNGLVGQFATIQTTGDVDWFRLDLAEAANVDLWFLEDVYRAYVDADGVWGGVTDSYYAPVHDASVYSHWTDHATNLNLRYQLYGASGGLISSGSRLYEFLYAGTYYLRLDGVGYGDPTIAASGGYTDYASIGDYLIRGTISPLSAPLVLPVITLGLTSSSSVTEAGAENLVFTFTRSVVTDDSLTVDFTYNGAAALGSDFAGLMPVYRQSVTFAANSATATVVIDPIADQTSGELPESVGLTLLSGFGYTIGTTTAVVGTILDSAPVVSTPVITLAVSPSSVSEDGTSNLVFTFTRSVVTADPLTVSFAASGSATNGVDYNGLVVGSSSQTLTFAANAANATVVIDPIADSGVESDETVSLTVLAGTVYTLGTNTMVSGTILNDDLASQSLNFTASLDTLTGMASTNTFRLMSLSDALWSSTPDRITNLNTVSDVIDIPAARSKALKPKVLGTVPSLDAGGLTALLTGRSFPRNGAATFTFNAGAGIRTFLAIDDGVSGFNAATDAVIEITGYTGSLSMLSLW